MTNCGRTILIGDAVLYHGRRFVLCGVDPCGVTPRSAYLADVATDDELVVPFEELILELVDVDADESAPRARRPAGFRPVVGLD